MKTNPIKLLLIGGGGHCKVIIDTLHKQSAFQIEGIIDIQEKKNQMIAGIPIIGTDEDLPLFYQKGIRHVFISLGSIEPKSNRAKLALKAKKIGFVFPNIISPNAKLAKDIKLGYGNFIGPMAVINPQAQLGNHCIINTGAIIEHDCIIEDFVHIAPGAILSGGITIQKQSHIGTGSCIKQGVIIGPHTLIGIGSVVVQNMPGHVCAFGNPCKIQ